MFAVGCYPETSGVREQPILRINRIPCKSPALGVTGVLPAWRQRQVGSPKHRTTAPTKKDMHDPCKSVLSVALYLFVSFCVFLWLTHFAAGKYIFGHKKSLEEAYFPAKSISFHTNSFSALVFFYFLIFPFDFPSSASRKYRKTQSFL